MLHRLSGFAIGVVTTTVLLTSLCAAFTALLPFIALKLLVPVPAVQRFMVRRMNWVGRCLWRWGNDLAFRLALGARRDIRFEGPRPTLDRSWLLVSNHRSWVDIPLLVDAVCPSAPFARFFLKRQLLWVPIVGQACWAFDMPFMKRHTKSEIAANPVLADDDMNATRRACERFRTQPVTVVNFVEGTRFTVAKRDAKKSPYQHLLRPKSGGLAFAVGAMGGQFAGVIDVTLAYRHTRRSPLWGFLCGDQRGMRITVVVSPLPALLLHGDYHSDAAYRMRFQAWLNGLWQAKEARIEAFLAEGTRPDS
ncbi:MAG: acyltransferase [Nevskiaceae bacterium]|nr:MAG: acyltransferase [Nevskiaceae bacterium]TBR72797.1 MAG: acyltransferase [Nevskiaceae bacterium]